MNIKIYAVYDSAVKSYMAPFFVQTEGQAVRSFSDTVNAVPPTMLGKHPEQFTLFHLGDFDDATGAIEYTMATAICRADAVKTESSSISEDVLARLVEIEKKLEIK